MSYTFILVSEGDIPVYEAEFQSTQKKDGPDTSHLNQLIIHAALDMVDETMWTTNTMCGRAPFRGGASPGCARARGVPWCAARRRRS